ncbi:MAG: DUF1385 domain-containing protein [bacterium]
MMRAPGGVAISVRKGNGSIVTRSFPYISRSRRRKALALPIVRGAVALVEMLTLGIQALNWSARQAAEDSVHPGEKNEEKTVRAGSNSAIVLALVLALAVGMGFFFYLPLIVAGLLVGHENQILFNLVDGLIRVAFFLGYVYLIQFLPDIRRIFQYHGAEHKAVFCYESGCGLSIDEAANHPTRHPRCGTSFLLIVLVFAIVLFAVADSLLFGLGGVTPSRLSRFFFHIVLLPIVAGASYELMRFSSRRSKNRLIRLLLSPGLALQRITTREPDCSQLEVGVTSLREALRFTSEEKSGTRLENDREA